MKGDIVVWIFFLDSMNFSSFGRLVIKEDHKLQWFALFIKFFLFSL